MRLYLIRHPQPEVATGVCYGSTDLGVVPAQQTAALAALPALPAGLPVYSSPLRRCSLFAALLAAQLGTQTTLDARLAEMHFGAWEMRAWIDIPRAEVDAWTSALIRYRPGGGESVLEVAQRVQAFHAELQARAQDAIVVCHAGTLRLLKACREHADAERIALHAAQRNDAIGYGELFLLES